MKCILARKIGMTQLFHPDGRVLPVTVLEAAPNTVTQVKTKDRDGYEAVQIGAVPIKERALSKPLRGHLKDVGAFRHLVEFRPGDVSNFSRGDTLSVEQFEPGDTVTVSGISVGKGFQGVVKRHGFKGGPATHGHRHALRSPGSIGATFPQRVQKGKRMAGRMGGERVSVKGLQVERIDAQKHLLFVSGAVPGKPGTLIEVVSTQSQS